MSTCVTTSTGPPCRLTELLRTAADAEMALVTAALDESSAVLADVEARGDEGARHRARAARQTVCLPQEEYAELRGLMGTLLRTLSGSPAELRP